MAQAAASESRDFAGIGSPDTEYYNAEEKPSSYTDAPHRPRIVHSRFILAARKTPPFRAGM
jgi:hypothetical protein